MPKKPKSESLAGYVSKNVYDGKRDMTPAETDDARRSVEANRDVLRVGAEQLERYDEALRLLAEGDRAPSPSFARPGLRAFFRLAAIWQLTDEEQSGLLGDPPPATFENWKANGVDELPPETLIRISYLLGIFQALETLYPGELSDAWLKLTNRNEIYAGETPLAYMLRTGIEGLRVTRRLLESRVHA